MTALIPQSEILHLIECKICTQPQLPPYLLCPNGHYTCNACLDRLDSCPFCRGMKREFTFLECLDQP